MKSNRNAEVTFGIVLALMLLSVAIWFALTKFYLWIYFVVAVKVFGLPKLTFWQFVGLEMLCANFFKSPVSTAQTQKLSDKISNTIVGDDD